MSNSKDPAGNTIISLHDSPDKEDLYYGISAANNPSTVPLTGFDKLDALPGDHDFSIGTINNRYIILLAPQTHDLIRLININLGVDVLGAFTKTTGVRVIECTHLNTCFYFYVHYNKPFTRVTPNL